MKTYPYKMKQTIILALGLILFTACGGGGGSDTPSAQSIAIDKIEAYATSGGTAPTVADYATAGVTGVTADNLDEINAVVEGLSAEDVDTEAEIQALVDSVGIPIFRFTSSSTVSVPECQNDALTLLTENADGAVTYSLSGGDVGSFYVSEGVVVFGATPDYETKDSYTFTATATDATGAVATQDVTISIQDDIIHNGVAYDCVTSPYTGEVWLDRNLGAEHVCTAFDDENCYGDYYQWGRNTDGHEDKNSATSVVLSGDVNSAGTAFITTINAAPWEWASVDATGATRSANWSKTDGSSVCPVGFRVPNITELRRETIDATNAITMGSTRVTNLNTAFTNFLKLPSAGRRSYFDGSVHRDGSVHSVSQRGYVYASSVSEVDDSRGSGIYFTSTIGNGDRPVRANGLSVRCLKD